MNHRNVLSGLLVTSLAIAAGVGCGSAGEQATEDTADSGLEGVHLAISRGGGISPYYPALDFEILAPANGASFSTDPATTNVTLQGLSSYGAGKVSVAAQVFSGGAWVAVGSPFTTSAVANAAGAFPWTYTITPAMLPAPWTAGGVLRVRVVVTPTVGGLPSSVAVHTFDEDSVANGCFANQQAAGATFQAAGSYCTSVFADQPVTSTTSSTIVVSSSFATPDQVSAPLYLNRPSPALQEPQPSTNDESATIAYYNSIGAPLSLSVDTPGSPSFKTKYGFAMGAVPAGSDEVSAVYYNNNDLGLGREMHCKSFVITDHAGDVTSGRACYVRNFVNVNAGHVDFGDRATSLGLTIAAQTNPAILPTATVAMVSARYSYVVGHPPFQANSLPRQLPVTFMVYDGNDNRQNFAQLDGTQNNDAVPNNCMTCHGAGSQDATPTAPGFLAFDPDVLVFDTSSAASPYTFAHQADRVRQLNAHVYNSNPAPGVQALLLAMYGQDPSNAAATFAPSYVPAGWQSQGLASGETSASARLYQDVVKPYCQTCHATTTSYRFDSYGTFPSVSAIKDACTFHSMPQDQQSTLQLWSGPARASLLSAYASTTDCNP